MLLKTTTLLLLCICLFSACKKETSLTQGPAVPNAFAVELNTWLEHDKPTSPSNNTPTHIDQLKQSLLLEQAHVEKLDAEEQLLVVPVKDSYKATYKLAAHQQVALLLLFNKAGHVRRGHVVVYTPTNRQSQKPLPSGTYAAIFTTGKVVANGQFRLYNREGQWKYQVAYKEGRLETAGYVKAGSEASIIESSCTDWYLVTTYYYSDGSSFQTSEYLGRTCNSCNDPMNPGLCRPEDGGGGSGGVDYEYAVTRQKQWTVKSDAWGYWKVVSTEELTGKQIPVTNDNPIGKKFTNITHKSEGIVNTNTLIFTWTKWGATTNVESELVASATISGKVTPPSGFGGDHNITPTTNYWGINEIIP